MLSSLIASGPSGAFECDISKAFSIFPFVLASKSSTASVDVSRTAAPLCLAAKKYLY